MHSRQDKARKRIWSLCAGFVALAAAQPAFAVCRVTDFSDKPLSAWNEMERVSFASQLELTEFQRLKALKPGDPNYYAPIAQAADVVAARKAAWARLESLKMDNIDDYRQVWVADHLTDEKMRKYADCITARQPGLQLAGRPDGPGKFNLTFSHLTPIGIEKITTRLVATYNIANPEDIEADLAKLGPQDNYVGRTVALRLIDPAKRAVVVMRGGWETPKFLYIPVYPTADLLK